MKVPTFILALKLLGENVNINRLKEIHTISLIMSDINDNSHQWMELVERAGRDSNISQFDEIFIKNWLLSVSYLLRTPFSIYINEDVLSVCNDGFTQIFTIYNSIHNNE